MPTILLLYTQTAGKSHIMNSKVGHKATEKLEDKAADKAAF